MKIAEAIAERIVSLANERNITTNKLATLCGITPSTVTSIIYNSSQQPKISTISKICEGLEITLSEFFDYPAFNNLDPWD